MSLIEFDMQNDRMCRIAFASARETHQPIIPTKQHNTTIMTGKKDYNTLDNTKEE
jgi:hypothetical protein